jgi:steroid 5-alpha reductase family enzyme
MPPSAPVPPVAALADGLPLNLVATLVAVAVAMGVTFAAAKVAGRHSVIDVTWGAGFALIAVVAWVLSAGDGDATRRAVVAVMTVLWGLRLASHIERRGRGKGEDPRYEELMGRAPAGRETFHVVTRVYLTQAVVMWFVSLPVQIAMYETGGIGVLAVLGVVVWAIGLTFEAVGDRQLAAFARDPASKGQVMDRGLWRYTRHPNYFGDACVWWGLWLVAVTGAGVWWTAVGPLVMTLLLVRVSGAGLLEKDIGTRRPGYAEYIERTSGFVPLPPRKGPKGARS